MTTAQPRASAPSTRARGGAAEGLVATLLEGEGYRIVARNFCAAGGEVDLVAWDGDVLCFIEVRSRANDEYGDPLETIDDKKIQRVVRAARAYIGRLEGEWPEMRFDAVGVVMSDPPEITLVRGAFEA